MQKRTRILQIVDGYRMGGAENKLLELIHKLDRNKYEVLLANVGPGGPLQAQFEALDAEIYSFPRRWAFDVKPILQLYRLLRDRDVAVVQTTLFWADVVGTIAAKLARVPLILSWETVSHEGDPYHNNFQRRAGYKLMASLTDRIIAVSHEVKESLVRRRRVKPDKIQVIHYGVDLNQFFPAAQDDRQTKRADLGIAPTDFLIGIVARLEPWKGHTFFIDAFSRLADEYPNAKAVFIGDGSLKSELEAQNRERGIADRIHFLGVRNDVAELVNCIDLFVLPSRPGEGLPNVLLEAMACGVPVIATRVGGVPELVRDGVNGYVVESGNIDALEKAIRAVLGDTAHLQVLGQHALQTVQAEFSLTRQIDQFEKIYDSAAA